MEDISQNEFLCDPHFILQQLSETNDGGEKYMLINIALEECGSGKRKKNKRKSINPWSCYLKICSKKDNGLSFQDCMTNEKQKKQEYEKNKNLYYKRAEEGCHFENG